MPNPSRHWPAVVHDVLSLTTGRLNLLLTDGRHVYGTRYGNSLFILGERPLSSEPLDDQPAWRELPDESLVVVTGAGRHRRSPPCERNAMTAESRIDVHLEPDSMARALEADVRAGLGSTPKTLPPKWFYDDRGSELFDEITRLPEYYPTRTERSILLEHAHEITELTKADTARRTRFGHFGEDPHPARRASATPARSTASCPST